MLAVMADVLLWFRLERLPTSPRTEVVVLVLVCKFLNRRNTADLHTADGVLKAVFVRWLLHR